MSRERTIQQVKALSGEEDVEVVEVMPARVRYDGGDLTPRRMIRVGRRFLVETEEHPGEWWIGEMNDGTVALRGSYGSLDEAASHH